MKNGSVHDNAPQLRASGQHRVDAHTSYGDPNAERRRSDHMELYFASITSNMIGVHFLS